MLITSFFLAENLNFKIETQNETMVSPFNDFHLLFLTLQKLFRMIISWDKKTFI